jgi:hypothetical protein
MNDNTKKLLKVNLEELERKRTLTVNDLEHYRKLYEQANKNLNSLESSIIDLRNILSIKLESEPK